ncbi:hypothetical protein AaE_015146 [Aphanomyces astaci]|uniref:Tc1-like transposase DDE domain-containing protein n=1 Tax=Aphanomyces astaci TaxID=112090 RepID=A0A6A4Z3P5_APHAT|nr:hypothetical protein AaE_015146 [Aphanomyces astaci]
MISIDMRWRCVVLVQVYGIEVDVVRLILGLSRRSVTRFNTVFTSTGNVTKLTKRSTESRWPSEVNAWVNEYATVHPCFYIEELEDALRHQFPTLKNVSAATICRALMHDLGLTRKVLERRAQESADFELRDYYRRLSPYYSYPDQLVFVDETSKDGRDSIRKYAWSKRNKKAIVELPFSRGQRVSALAAFTTSGFLAWDYVDGTFDRATFHDVMVKKILPYLNPWPLPRSILILDNAKIHMYKERQDAVHRRGALLFFLPPYFP